MVVSQFVNPICIHTPSLFSLSSPSPTSLRLRLRLGPKPSSACTNSTINQTRNQSVQFPGEASLSRRQLCSVTTFLTVLAFGLSIPLKSVRAEDKLDKEEKDDSIIGSVKSLFDPNETTKSGKVLPKAYLKSAREVVKTLRESLQEDRKDMAKFRRTADAAKESIRDYLSNWRDQQSVSKEESYMVLEKAFRSLAKFYAKAGPSASLSDDVKSEILHDLDRVELYL